MGGFAVDLEALGRLGADLDAARELLGGALAAMEDAAPAGLGSDDLDGACAEFRQSWSHGLTRLGECVQHVRTGIDATRAEYAAADSAVAEGFRDRVGPGAVTSALAP